MSASKIIICRHDLKNEKYKMKNIFFSLHFFVLTFLQLFAISLLQKWLMTSLIGLFGAVFDEVDGILAWVNK